MGSRPTYPPAMELRKDRRFRITLPVRFAWQMQGKPTRRGRGISRDISTRGVFLTTHTPPPLGALVQLEIEVRNTSTTCLAHLEGEGAVVRVEQPIPGRTNSASFAAAVHFYAETSWEKWLCLVPEQASGASHSAPEPETCPRGGPGMAFGKESLAGE